MLLAIDIGNTNISLGVFAGESIVARWRLETVRDRTSDEYGILTRQMFAVSEINRKEISAVVVASVVPPLDIAFREISEKYFGRAAIFIDSRTDFGMPIKYNPPLAVGADRITGAFAAREIYGAPCVVVDFGTATNIEAVNSRGEYLGGAIAPGVKLFASALSNNTSKLPFAEIKKPETVIGNSTAGSLSSGLYYGYAGLIDGILRRTIDELGGKPRVVATGGLAPLMAGASEFIEIVDGDLMLKGLRLVYERIKNS